jgi:acetyl esterase/lipase
VPDIAARANPMSYLDSAPSLPPFFLAVGTGDRLVPHQQTLALAAALRAHDAAVTLEVIEGALHADPAVELPLTASVLTWLEGLRSGR